MLNRYIADTQDLLNDTAGQFFTLPRMIRNINRSRRRIAAMSGVLRVVPTGVITIANQEAYPLTMFDPMVQVQMPGVETSLFCRTISIGIGGKWENGQIVGGSWKPTWRRIPWTSFQSRFRLYGGTFIGTISDPGWWAQLGVGQLGKIYLAPIPTQFQPMELDLTCIPYELRTDNDPEPLVYPWTDAVPYWAAVYCLLQQQRPQDAKVMAELFAADMPMCAAVVCPQFVAAPYGANLLSA